MKNLTRHDILNVKKEIKNQKLDPFIKYKKVLEEYPFIIIIGKYDHVLGPRAIYSSISIEEEQQFVRNLLRDALNTKNKFVILDFDLFYAQIYKIEITDDKARGRKQLYTIILLRDIESPLIPIVHFRRIEMMFRKIGDDVILLDDHKVFQQFFNELSDIYLKKDEILPIESFNLQIRSGINTIQGFCELILEEKRSNSNLSRENLGNSLEMILDSCEDIIKSLESHLKNALK